MGKTTILNELEKAGQMTVSEVAREIITEEQKKENGILPWTDLASFQGLVIQKQLRQEEELQKNHHKKIFFDRALVDNIAYAELGRVSLRSDLQLLIENADYKRVFFLEQLPSYQQDRERKEDRELARKIHEQLYQVYDRLGFDIVTVPVFDTIEARVNFVLKEAQCEKNREIEKKYRVAHDQVKEALGRYAVKYTGTDTEENNLYDLNGILKDLGCVFRIRQNNGNHLLTLKGPSKSSEFTNKVEYNFLISQPVSTALDLLLPKSVSYSKRRENYKPLGDSSCTISLDHLPGLGEFVEIEAATENQVLLWEKRLGISEYAINRSYPALVKEQGGR